MKNSTGLSATQWLVPLIALSLTSAACSGLGKKGKSGEELAATGPTVVTARANPETIELNKNFQTMNPAEIVAEVKDFSSKVTEVRVRFVRVPMEVQMQNIGGSTWRAQLTPQQLRTLAVGGETMTYEANIVARNEEGLVAISRQPVDIVVKAPDLAQKMG